MSLYVSLHTHLFIKYSVSAMYGKKESKQLQYHAACKKSGKGAVRTQQRGASVSVWGVEIRGGFIKRDTCATS